uniref:Secreted protein n=2 Tax=Thraustotheca clavata TaxID=74557 RepID=A0A0A7CMN1_9STRA|nr:secreted protein [Thraustotheca clavata]
MVRFLLAAALTSIIAISSVTDAFNPLLVKENTILKNLQKFESRHPTEDTVKVNDEWFEKQILDHDVNANCGAEPKYWKQRFHVNSQFYKGPGSPVFLYIHGENVAEAGYITSKYMYIVHEAEKYGAMLVALEHRFYGLSQPTPDMSTENLKYHTSDQALADLANFQDYFIANRNISTSSPWVAFGGSYPGMLAAWTKYRFPDRFAGSIASSAPIDIKADFYGYMDVVARGLHTIGGDECTNTLQEGLKQFHALVASEKPEDLATLNKLFNPCTPFKTDLDRMDIEANIMGAYQGFAQNNDWDKYVEKNACADLTAKDGLTPLEKVAKINARTFTAESNCTNSNYQNDWVTSVQDTTTDTVNINRQWTFQTCNEFGFGQTAAKSTGPFSELKYVTVERVYYQMCKDVFGITDTDARIAAKRANYHGLDINVANVAFPSGTIDPWSNLAPDNTTKLANPTSKVVFIEGTSHCGDMNSPDPADSPSLQWAHQQIDAAIASFIKK